MAQWLACWAHNPKVPGSKPGSAKFVSRTVRSAFFLSSARSTSGHVARTLPYTLRRDILTQARACARSSTHLATPWHYQDLDTTPAQRAVPLAFLYLHLPFGQAGPLRLMFTSRNQRHCVRAAKEMDSKSIGLCPQLWKTQSGHSEISAACPELARDFPEPPVRAFGIVGKIAAAEEVLKALRLDAARSIQHPGHARRAVPRAVGP